MTKILDLFRHLLEKFDPYGREHGLRVSKLAVRLAERSGVLKDSDLMRDIQTAAEIHDVGKVGVPESVRRQTGLYLPVERLAMEQHAVYGAELISYVINGTINGVVVEIVYQHHEHFGGTGGYPRKLKGDAIHIGARIVSICDVYDALTHDRGYRRAMSTRDALKEMEEHQVRTEFADPKLLRLFIAMMKNDG